MLNLTKNALLYIRKGIFVDLIVEPEGVFLKLL